MNIPTIRGFFWLLCGIVAYYIGTLLEMKYPGLGHNIPTYATLIGLLVGLVLIFVEMQLKHVAMGGLSSIVFGVLFGVFITKLLTKILALLPLGDFLISIVELVLTLIFCYLGVVIALRGQHEFNVIIPYVRFRRQSLGEGVILLDTSAIIDGRITQIYHSGFLSGRLFVPNSVLQELQQLADSENELKHHKGRRGLEIIHEMQKDPRVEIRIFDDDTYDAETVDERLLKIAKILGAGICTTDFNLAQVATMQNIEIFNPNDLAAALRPTIHAGDTLTVRLVKEGKEPNQALAYLDDGTMIVVNDAQHFIGKDAEVHVNSVLQTQSGKMIFAEMHKK